MRLVYQMEIAMIALDGEHYSRFLLEENGRLFLDTVCSYSAVDYMFLLEMTEEEASLFGKNGRPYLDNLAQRIRSSAPGVWGNKSPFKTRSWHTRASGRMKRLMHGTRTSRHDRNQPPIYGCRAYPDIAAPRSPVFRDTERARTAIALRPVPFPIRNGR